jgi:hypothetical protein
MHHPGYVMNLPIEGNTVVNNAVITLGAMFIAINSIINLLNGRSARQNAKKASEERADVKTALVTSNSHVTNKLNRLQDVSDDSHKLLNNNMGVSLRNTLRFAEADLASKKQVLSLTRTQKARKLIETEIEIAKKDVEVAKAALDEHNRRQANVDRAVQDRINTQLDTDESIPDSN